ncbi:MAG: PIG-L family deacetylase [Verrucomicrobiales bacterium]
MSNDLSFSHPDADIFVPDFETREVLTPREALARTTHLCIVSHQDDIEIAAYHGIAECFQNPEKWFSGVVVTDGASSPRKGPYSHFTDEEMRTVRKIEQRKAAFIGEYSCCLQLAHPSRDVRDFEAPQVRADLRQIIEIAKPDVLYIHNPADKHDTHVATLMRCIEAIRLIPQRADRPKKVYGCEVWRNLDWVFDDDKIVLPVDKYVNIAAALVGVFDSQITGGKRYDLATEGRGQANATYWQPRDTDSAEALTWAMDLTALVEDDDLTVEEHTLGFINRFKEDVFAKIRKYSGPE